MRRLRITGCSDSSMWYAGLIGQLVPYVGEDPGEYLSREPAGYVNIVKKADAEIVNYYESANAVLSIDGVPVGGFVGPFGIAADGVAESESSPRVLRTFEPISLRLTLRPYGQIGKSTKVQRYKDAKPRW